MLMNTAIALQQAGFPVSSAEGEFVNQDFQVAIQKGEGEDFDVQGSGSLELEWVEFDPPTIPGQMTTQMTVGTEVSYPVEITGIIEGVSVSPEEVTVGKEETRIYRVKAVYSWSADFVW